MQPLLIVLDVDELTFGTPHTHKKVVTQSSGNQVYNKKYIFR